MNWQKYKWSIVATTIALTFALLGASQFFWQQYALDKPLTQLLQSVDGVETIAWDNRDKNQPIQKINITLNKVNNLQKTYQAINDNTLTILGSKKYKIILTDHRTPELEQLYYSLHYSIQEAIFTGKFSTMAEIIQEKARAADSQAQVYVDANYVYLQLVNSNGNLYTIIPRHVDSPEVK